MLIWPGDLREERLLVVDDERAVLDLIQIILDSEGYHKTTYLNDSRQAIACCRSERPALVLLDLNMPHPDGFVILDRINELPTEIRPAVLVLTGQADATIAARALAAGARDVLTKPLSTPEVTVRVANTLETRLLENKIEEQNRVFDERVNQRSAELRASQLEVVYRLAMAAERRDMETGQHIIRMSRYCGLVAEAGGWTPEEVDLMMDASPLHDVGKIAIPDAILLKPGPLTPDEWVTMRSHTKIGADMLRGGTSPVMKLGRTIALSHHERWDGSGYPDGLAGVDIPLSARICAVCDVFDAVTSERCYHHAMDMDTGVKMIRDGTRRHFDPNVVGWFERALPQIVEIAGRKAH